MQRLFDDDQIPRPTFGSTSSKGEIGPSKSMFADIGLREADSILSKQ